MRTSALTPAYAPLPFGAAQADIDPSTAPDFAPEAVARFDALLHEIHPDAPRVNVPRLRGLAASLMAMPSDEALQMLALRMTRINSLRALLRDADWNADDAMRARVSKLVDYVDRDDDLIPDGTDLLGKLDDVLLFELAWPAFEDEAEEYIDFCAYRHDEHPDGDAAHQRAAWVRDRLAELALLQHIPRVNDSHYANGRMPATPFRIGGG